MLRDSFRLRAAPCFDDPRVTVGDPPLNSPPLSRSVHSPKREVSSHTNSDVASIETPPRARSSCGEEP